MNHDLLIRANLMHVKEQIAQACARTGRDPEAVLIVAVSKLKSVEDILAALDAGITHLGENRVEEALRKIPQVAERAVVPPVWHMIGHIQSRKVRDVVPNFQIVESVDRLSIAQKLSTHAVSHDCKLRVLLEINIAGEDQKYGFQAHNWQSDSQIRSGLWQDFEAILSLPGLSIEGLMTMAPYLSEMEATRPVFVSLRELREALSTSFGVELPHLSMGMTNDYPVAVEEGATIVRIGRGIFGER